MIVVWFSNVMFRFYERPISFNISTYLKQASRKTGQCVKPHATSMFIRSISKTHHKTTPTFLLHLFLLLPLKWVYLLRHCSWYQFTFSWTEKMPRCLCSCVYDEKSKSTTPHLSRRGTQSCHWECGWSPTHRPSRPQRRCPRHAAAAQSTCVPRTYTHIQNTVRLLGQLHENKRKGCL